MTQNIKVAAVVVVIVGIAAWLLLWGRDDDEAAIHRQLDNLAGRIAKDGGESHLEGIGQARRVTEYFTERPEIQIFRGRTEIYPREQLAGMVIGLRGRAQTVALDFSRRRVTVSDDGRQAVAEFTARANARFPGGAESHRARYRTEWRKEGGDWLMARVQLLED